MWDWTLLTNSAMDVKLMHTARTVHGLNGAWSRVVFTESHELLVCPQVTVRTVVEPSHVYSFSWIARVTYCTVYSTLRT